jgi:hypothetical protein
MCAASGDHIACVQLLLESGAAIDAKNEVRRMELCFDFLCAFVCLVVCAYLFDEKVASFDWNSKCTCVLYFVFEI